MASEGKRADMLVHEIDPFNAEPPRGALTGNDLTAVDSFYVRNHGPVPELDDSAWRLRVDGSVDHELELSLEELREQFDARIVVATMQCAGNRREGLAAVRDIPGEAPWGPGATGNARWAGAALADVLRAANLRGDATDVAFEGADTSQKAKPPQRFGASIPLHKAMAGEVLLAWEMNGEPLPKLHGAPVRVVVPGYIGARSVKWLERITPQATPSENFFHRNYRLLPPDADPDEAPPDAGVVLGAVALNSDILAPADGETVAAGPVEVSGYAFAGDDRHIVRVDVSTDGGGRWQQAQLLDDLGPWAWRRWQAQVVLSPGSHRITARAWDSSAATQPEDPAQLWNPKGYVNNAWARINVNVEP
ncbi:MAG: sulfite oxidase [Solirubrobacteraceae bacterium]